jgi:hypothetical protein
LAGPTWIRATAATKLFSFTSLSPSELRVRPFRRGMTRAELSLGRHRTGGCPDLEETSVDFGTKCDVEAGAVACQPH